MPDLIYLDQPDLSVRSAFSYVLAANVSFNLLMASVNYDGTTTTVPFVPVLAILAQDGTICGYFGQDVLAQANDTVFMTWAPCSQPPATPFATGDYATQSNMPVTPLENGWQIWVSARDKDNGGLGSSAAAVSGLSLIVEQTSGPRDALASGPFMLVPGPGA